MAEALQSAVEAAQVAQAELQAVSANAEAVKCEAEAAKAVAQAEVETAAAAAVVADISEDDISEEDFETWLQGRMEQWSEKLLADVNAAQALSLESFRLTLTQMFQTEASHRQESLMAAVTAANMPSIQQPVSTPEPEIVVIPEQVKAESGSGGGGGARTLKRRRI